MADLPEKIFFGIGSGATRAMMKLPDDTYADRVAPSASGGLVTEVTGQVTFDINSLPCKRVYGPTGNIIQLTCGPDAAGRFVRQTYTWDGDNQVGDSAWFMVSGMDAP